MVGGYGASGAAVDVLREALGAVKRRETGQVGVAERSLGRRGIKGWPSEHRERHRG